MDFGASIGGALGLGTGRVAAACLRALDESGLGARRVVVVGDELARALGKAELQVVSVSPSPRRRRKGPPQVAARLEHLPFDDGAADAVFTAGLPPQAIPALRELHRLCRHGGLVGVATTGSALVRKVAPPETLAAAFVHASLVDVEQRAVGSVLLTLGRVRKWGRSSRPLVG